eukprot:12107233-Alexandrium_andersonii.AAC.1
MLHQAARQEHTTWKNTAALHAAPHAHQDLQVCASALAAHIYARTLAVRSPLQLATSECMMFGNGFRNGGSR